MNLAYSPTYQPTMEEERSRLDNQITQIQSKLFNNDLKAEETNLILLDMKSRRDKWLSLKMKGNTFISSYWPKISQFITKKTSISMILWFGIGIFGGILILILSVLINPEFTLSNIALFPWCLFLFTPSIVLGFYLFYIVLFFCLVTPILLIILRYFDNKLQDIRTQIDQFTALKTESQDILNSLENAHTRLDIRAIVTAANLPPIFFNEEDHIRSSHVIQNLTIIFDKLQKKQLETQQLVDQFIADLQAKQRDFETRKDQTIQRRNQGYIVDLIKKFLDELHPGDEFFMDRAIEIIMEEGKAYPVSRLFIRQFLEIICNHIEGFQYIHLKETVRCNSKSSSGDAALSTQIDNLFAVWIQTKNPEDIDTVVTKFGDKF